MRKKRVRKLLKCAQRIALVSSAYKLSETQHPPETLISVGHWLSGDSFVGMLQLRLSDFEELDQACRTLQNDFDSGRKSKKKKS